MGYRAASFKTSLDRVEVTLHEEPAWTSGMLFTVPLLAGFAWLAQRALAEVGGDWTSVSAWRDVSLVLTIPLAWLAIAVVLGALTKFSALFARPPRTTRLILDAGKRAALISETTEEGATVGQAQYQLAAVSRIDLQWDRVERRSIATLGIIPFAMKGVRVVAIIDGATPPSLAPFAIGAATLSAGAVREINTALRSWQVVRERDSERRKEEPRYKVPPDPRATAKGPMEVGVVMKRQTASIVAMFVLLMGAAAWLFANAATQPPLMRDTELREWGEEYWNTLFTRFGVPRLEEFDRENKFTPTSLTMTTDDGGSIDIRPGGAPGPIADAPEADASAASVSPFAISGDEAGLTMPVITDRRVASATPPGHQPNSGTFVNGGAVVPPPAPAAGEVQIEMGAELMGEVYPDLLPFEEQLFAALDRYEERYSEVAAAGEDPAAEAAATELQRARLATFVGLFEEYQKRGAASRPALERVSEGFYDYDMRVVRAAIECVGLVGDEDFVQPLSELRTRLMYLARDGEEPTGYRLLLDRIEKAQDRIRSRRWELR